MAAAAAPASTCSQGSRQGRPAPRQALELLEIVTHCFPLQKWWDLAGDRVKAGYAGKAALGFGAVQGKVQNQGHGKGRWQ